MWGWFSGVKGICVVAGVVVLGVFAGVAAPSSADAVSFRPNSCVKPPDLTLAGVAYKSKELVRSYVRVSHVVGVGSGPAYCNDVVVCRVGSVCEPVPRVAPAKIRVWRIRGISPRLALSRAGSSRSLFVAGTSKCAKLDREGALLRCLRAASS